MCRAISQVLKICCFENQKLWESCYLKSLKNDFCSCGLTSRSRYYWESYREKFSSVGKKNLIIGTYKL